MKTKNSPIVFKSFSFRKTLIPGAIFGFLAFSFAAHAAPANTLNYQGKLTDTQGAPVADTNYDFKLTLWDSASGGTCLWSALGSCGTPTAKTLATKTGIYATELGASGDNALNLDFNSDVYLQIQVNTDSPMSPRRKVNASAYSLNTKKLDGQDSSYYLNASTEAQTKQGHLTVNGDVTVGNSSSDHLVIYGGNASNGDITTTSGSMTLKPQAGQNLNVSLSTTGDFAVNTSQLYVDTSTGNVGIGTANPQTLMDIVSDQPSSGTSDDITLTSYGSTYNSAVAISSRRARGSASSPAAVQSGDLLAGYYASGYNGSSFAVGTYITTNAEDVFSTSPKAGLRFGTNDGTALAERMRISASGFVGIGTTNPEEEFHVQINAPTGDDRTSALFENVASGNAAANNIIVRSGTSSTLLSAAHPDYVVVPNHTNKSLLVSRDNDGLVLDAFGASSYMTFETGGAHVERMRIDESGRVGIGTTNPSYKFHVYNDPTGYANAFSLGVNDFGNRILSVDATGNLNLRLPKDDDPSNSAVWIRDGNTASGFKFYAAGSTSLQTYGADGTTPSSLSINYLGGNVGIGTTTSPSNPFTVVVPTTTGTGMSLTANSLTSGTGMYLNTSSITSGNLLYTRYYNTADTTAFTGNLGLFSMASTWTGASSPANTGNMIEANRAITMNSAGYTNTVSGAVLRVSDTATLTAGAFAHTANVLEVVQSYASNSGSALLATTAGTGYAFRANDDGTTTDTTPFVVDDGGNVGIGTAAPGTKLEVSGSIRTPYLDIRGDNGQVASRPYFRGLASHSVWAPAQNLTSGADVNTMYIAYPGDLNASDTVTARIQETLFISATGPSGNGNIGIGSATPADKLDVRGDIRVGTGTTGCVKDADGTTIAGTCSSDERLKKNITSLTGIVDRLTKLNPVSFNWRSDEFPERNLGSETQYGLIAQEVETVFPELVKTGDDGYKQVAYHNLPIYLLEGMKEQQDRISETEKKFATLFSASSEQPEATFLTLGDTTLETNDTLSKKLEEQKDKITLLLQTTETANQTIELLQAGFDNQQIQLTALMDFYTNLKLGNFLTLDEKNNLILPGNLTVNDIEAKIVEAEGLETRTLTAASAELDNVSTRAFAVKNEEGSETIGTAEIPAGETKVAVKTKAVGEGSKVFVTLSGNNAFIPIVVASQEDEVGFVVEIQERQDQDVKFNWWIVGGSGNDE